MKAKKLSKVGNDTDYTVTETPYNVMVRRVYTKINYKNTSYLTFRIYGNGPMNGVSGQGGIRNAMKKLSA